MKTQLVMLEVVADTTGERHIMAVSLEDIGRDNLKILQNFQPIEEAAPLISSLVVRNALFHNLTKHGQRLRSAIFFPGMIEEPTHRLDYNSATLVPIIK